MRIAPDKDSFEELFDRAFGALLWAVLLCGCFSPKPEDQTALKKVEAKYAERYKFDLDEYGYLLVRARDRADDEEVIAIYKDFTLDENGNRRGTGIVWLNVYDRDGEFLYQLAFDPGLDRFVRSNQEFH